MAQGEKLSLKAAKVTGLAVVMGSFAMAGRAQDIVLEAPGGMASLGAEPYSQPGEKFELGSREGLPNPAALIPSAAFAVNQSIIGKVPALSQASPIALALSQSASTALRQSKAAVAGHQAPGVLQSLRSVVDHIGSDRAAGDDSGVSLQLGRLYREDAKGPLVGDMVPVPGSFKPAPREKQTQAAGAGNFRGGKKTGSSEGGGVPPGKPESESDKPAVSVETRTKLRDAATRLLRDSHRPIQWSMKLPADMRYVEVPLWKEKTFDGFGYSALVLLKPGQAPNNATSFILKKTGGLAGVTYYSTFVLNSGEEAASTVSESAKPAVNEETKTLLRRAANDLLRNNPPIQWEMKSPAGARYVEVPLWKERSFDGFGYSALVLLYGSGADPNDATYFILKKTGGLASRTLYSKPVLVGHSGLPESEEKKGAKPYARQDLPAGDPVKTAVERVADAWGQENIMDGVAEVLSGRLVTQGLVKWERVSATALEHFKDEFFRSQGMNPDGAAQFHGDYGLDGAVAEAAFDIARGLSYDPKVDDNLPLRKTISGLVRGVLGEPSHLMHAAVFANPVFEGRDGKPWHFGYVLFLNEHTGAYIAFYGEESKQGSE